MTLKELVDRARRASPGIAPDIDDAQALLLLRAVCTELLAQIDACDDGSLAVPELGHFEIQQLRPAASPRVVFVPEERS